MPAQKKHASTRARRNRAATAATLVDDEPVDRSGWSAAALRAEINERNKAKGADETPLSKGGGKAAMVAALLDDDYQIPELPDRPQGWHAQTVAWWRDVWMSPMSKEWHPESDWHNVTMGAMHYDDMWCADTAKLRQEASKLFKVTCDFLGLNPYARRRLEWTVETALEAQERGQQRRSGGGGGRTEQGPPPAQQPADPRLLHAVKDPA